MEPLQQFNSFGISERVRTETSSSPSAPVHVGVRVHLSLVRFSLVQFGSLRQGFQIPRSQNQTVSVPVFLTPPSTASHSCPSPRSTPGSCHRTGSPRWSHDCCGRCSDGSEPGVLRKNTKFDNLVSLIRLLLAGCVFCVRYRTLNWEHGYVNRWTFPKSSPETRRLWSWLLQTALTSVPSEPSGHKPEERAEGQNQQRNRRKGEEASSYQTHGSPEGRYRWPSQCLWWSPHWPPVYTLMGSLRTLLPNIATHKIWGKSLCHGSCDIRQFLKKRKWKKQ